MSLLRRKSEDPPEVELSAYLRHALSAEESPSAFCSCLTPPKDSGHTHAPGTPATSFPSSTLP